MLAREVSAIALGYLLGSVPTAYLVTRWRMGKDIRRLGGGNVGGLNTFREVGTKAGIFVVTIDIAKGATSVYIAHWLLGVSELFVMLAGLAAVVGHNWMVFLKFSGGKGVGVTLGIMAVIMPVYGYITGLLIFLGIIIAVLAVTRNVALSTGTAIFFLPLIVWLGTNSGTGTIIAIALGLIVAIRFFPTARAAWAKNENKRDFFFDRPGKKRD